MATKKDSEALRVTRVRQLWQALYPPKVRTETKVLDFYGWLQQHRPDFLPRPRGKGDPYQHLKADLKGLIRDK
jgi:hypothetical protein